MTETKRSHEDVEMLLPWFVNGTLDSFEQSNVEEHLAACDRCRSAVDDLNAIRKAAGGHSATPLVPEPRIDQLNARIDRYENGKRRRRAAAAMAAGAGLIAMFLAYTPVEFGSHTPEFRTATSEAPSGFNRYVLEVRFADGFPVDQRQAFVEKFNGKILTADDRASAIEVMLETSATSVGELRGLVGELEREEAVESAKVVAVHLPLKEDHE